jgi:hypothetical protein
MSEGSLFILLGCCEKCLTPERRAPRVAVAWLLGYTGLPEGGVRGLWKPNWGLTADQRAKRKNPGRLVRFLHVVIA